MGPRAPECRPDAVERRLTISLPDVNGALPEANGAAVK